MSLINEQLPPQQSSGDVWLLVLRDMEDRRVHGIDKYGTPLQINNGRDPLIDAYQEVLDLCVYLRQKIEENTQIKQLVADIKEYVVYHGVLIGECVAWNKLKTLVGIK